MNLNQITIAANDVSVSLKFYQSLGLVFIVDALPRYVRLECPNGQSTFSIHQKHFTPGELKQCVSIYFEVDDLDATYEKLLAKGITFEEGPVDKPYLWRELHLCDPDGHALIVFEAGKNRKHPPWRLLES